MLNKISNLIKYCFENSVQYQFYTIEFQLFLLSSKSLIPYEDKIGCMFNLDRYKMELETFKYYKNGEDKIIEKYINTKNSFDFQNNEYNINLEYEILPIAISNTNWDILINEVIKSQLFLYFNEKNILDCIILCSCIYFYLTTKNDFDDGLLEQSIREKLVDFSLKDIMQYVKLELNKKDYIDFEKLRIIELSKKKILTQEVIHRYKIIEHILLNKNSSKTVPPNNEEVVLNFSLYLHKLRNGIIDPNKLKIQTKIYPFENYIKKDTFSHPLLGKTQVIKRKTEYIVIKNKIGLLKVYI